MNCAILKSNKKKGFNLDFRIELYHQELIYLILPNNKNQFTSNPIILNDLKEIEEENENIPIPNGILDNLCVDYPDVNNASQLDYYRANKTEVG